MTRVETPREERYAVAWALPADDTEQPDANVATPVPATFDTGRHCPACGSRRMQPLHGTEVGRCDRCLDCRRLWAIHDGRLELFLGGRPARVPSRGRASP
jgi:hypothetical protein